MELLVEYYEFQDIKRTVYLTCFSGGAEDRRPIHRRCCHGRGPLGQSKIRKSKFRNFD